MVSRTFDEPMSELSITGTRNDQVRSAYSIRRGQDCSILLTLSGVSNIEQNSRWSCGILSPATKQSCDSDPTSPSRVPTHGLRASPIPCSIGFA
jgi:hypothetical protein